jgi:hypothetical protein
VDGGEELWQGQGVEMDLLLELEEELSWEWGESEIKRGKGRGEVEFMEGGGWDGRGREVPCWKQQGWRR